MIFGWKQKLDKLRLCLLSSSDLYQELPERMLQEFEIRKSLAREQIDEVQAFTKLKALSVVDPNEPTPFIWEPLSDKRGEPISLFGWNIKATMYFLNGQLWWLVNAHRKRASAKDREALDRAIDYLGGDTKRDFLMSLLVSEDSEDCPLLFWSWFNTQPLFEIQVNAKTKDMKIVPQNTPEANGYARVSLKNNVPS